MIRLSKKVEYALLSLQYMSQRKGQVCTVKEISERYNVSFELLAKVLSALSKKGLAVSLQGVNGGFMVNRAPESISIADVIHAVEGNKTQIVECLHDTECGCYVEEKCTIRNPLQRLQKAIDSAFTSMTVQDLLASEPEFVSLDIA